MSVRVAGKALSDADVAMERYADGDRAAGGQLYDLLRPRIFAIGFQWTRSASEAEDLVQDTFVKLTEARGTFRRGARVMPWACTMARNLLTDDHRHRSFEQVVKEAIERNLAELEGQRPNEELVDVSAMLEAVLEILERLPAALKDSFKLVVLDGHSVKQAARRLGITEGMVKIRTFRARAKLLAEAECRWRDR